MTGRHLLRLEHVRRGFDHGSIVALDGVDLAFDRSESVAIVGRSGSGKSCLLNVATGLDRPDDGRVLWEGREVASRQEWARLRRTEIGIVFQEFHLLPTLTAQQNVELALMGGRHDRAEQRRRAAAALERVGLGAREHQLPSELSGGERQRVAIARALVREPAALFADEPTGNLDSGNAEAIEHLLFELHAERDMALILVTHDGTFAERCARVVSLSDGRVVEDRLMPGQAA